MVKQYNESIVEELMSLFKELIFNKIFTNVYCTLEKLLVHVKKTKIIIIYILYKVLYKVDYNIKKITYFSMLIL